MIRFPFLSICEILYHMTIRKLQEKEKKNLFFLNNNNKKNTQPRNQTSVYITYQRGSSYQVTSVSAQQPGMCMMSLPLAKRCVMEDDLAERLAPRRKQEPEENRYHIL